MRRLDDRSADVLPGVVDNRKGFRAASAAQTFSHTRHFRAASSNPRTLERSPMTRIDPDKLTADLLVQSRSAENNYLIQTTHAEYRAASKLSEELSISLNDFLLWLHVPDSGVTLPGQADLGAIEDIALNVALLDSDENGHRALERQAFFRNLTIDQYIRQLVLKGLAEDEQRCVFGADGAVAANRDAFGSLFKYTRNPKPVVQEVGKA
jgi:hypothetical protein